MWKDLTMSQKSEVMKMAIQQGLSDLNSIKEMYDTSINIGNTSPNNTYDNVPYNPSPKDVRYDDGGMLSEIIITPDRDYNVFLNSLPPNQRYGDGSFNTYRYWELHGKPTDFEAALKTNPPMYTLEDDGYYHADSVAYNKDNDTYEFMKSPDHPTVDLELLQYWNNPDLEEFRSNYGLDLDSNPYKYIRRETTDKPLYAYGGPLGNIYKGTGGQSQKLKKGDIWSNGTWTSADLATELKRLGVRARVTSGYRTAEQQKKFKTPPDRSWHVKNKAVDVVPLTNFSDLREDLLKPEVQALFAKAGIGVYDETPKRVQKRTGATGAHYHIGPDDKGKIQYKNWLAGKFPDAPTIDYSSPVYHHSVQDMVWTPPVYATRSTDNIAPAIMETPSKPMIVDALAEDTTPTVNFDEMWASIFPQVEESTPTVVTPYEQFMTLQSRPRHTIEPTPIVMPPAPTVDNNYLLFEPMNTLGYGGNLFGGGGNFLTNMVDNIINSAKKVGAIARKEKIGPTYNSKKKRWYNAKGQELVPGKGYYSKSANKFVQYNSDGTVSKYSPMEWADKKGKDIEEQRLDLVAKKYGIPTGNEVKLSQNGKQNKDRGAWVNQAMVDSLLKYGNIAGIPKWEALGLAATESTFGNSKNRQIVGYPRGTSLTDTETKMIYEPVGLLSNWHYYDVNPYTSFTNAVIKIPSIEGQLEAAKLGVPNLEKQASNFVVDVPPILDAFNLYKSGKYNPGNLNYYQMVKTRGDDLKFSPEMVEMVNNSKYNY